MDSPVTSTYLRLSAPLQSWATSRVTGNIVRTQLEPTTDALRGLVAASLGAKRGEWPDWLRELQFTIRVDRPGSLVDEFQTINPRDEDLEFQRRLFALTSGKIWSKAAHFTPDGQNLTAIVRRTYLGDAEFLVEIHAPTHSEDVSHALRHPTFTPYLGRKAFAPTFPYYLGVGDPQLLERLPTIERKANAGQGEPTWRRGSPDPHTADTDGTEGAEAKTAKLRLVKSAERSTVEVPLLPYSAWLRSVRTVVSASPT